VLIALERAKSIILHEREFSGIFSLAGGGNFAFPKREFPVALVYVLIHHQVISIRVHVHLFYSVVSYL